MYTIFTMELPGLPPTINNYYRRSYHSVYKTESAREWQEDTVDLMREKWNGKPPITSAVELEITYLVHSRHRWDIDNRIKSLQDCLELAGIIKNDNQVEKLIVSRLYKRDNTKTLITLRSIPSS